VIGLSLKRAPTAFQEQPSTPGFANLNHGSDPWLSGNSYQKSSGAAILRSADAFSILHSCRPSRLRRSAISACWPSRFLRAVPQRACSRSSSMAGAGDIDCQQSSCSAGFRDLRHARCCFASRSAVYRLAKENFGALWTHFAISRKQSLRFGRGFCSITCALNRSYTTCSGSSAAMASTLHQHSKTHAFSRRVLIGEHSEESISAMYNV